MAFQKNRISIELLIICVFLFTCQTPAHSRSVYAIPKHDYGETLNVYDVMKGLKEGQLGYRASYNLPNNISPNDVSIDIYSNVLFITSELRNEIELLNARTFLGEGTITAQEASDLAGVLIYYVDADTTVLYTVDRGTNKLFMYDWDAEAKELTPLPYSGSQPWYELQPEDPASDPCVFACGLALDEVNGTIYVSQLERISSSNFTYSNIIYAYDPNVSAPDPNDRFGCTRKIDLGQYEGKDNYAVDIDVDSDNGWLYAGGFNLPEGYYESHNNLIRYDLIDEPNSPGDDGHIQDIGAGVIGLAVSPGTSYVYMTTFNQQLEAWDTDTWTKIDAEDIDDGGGVCVAQEGYVPPFEVVKTDDVEGCASPRGQEIEYTISVDYQWAEFGYADPNIIDSIEIVDYLPAEVNFVSALPDTGQYEYDDPNGGRYTWIITDANSFEETQSFKLIVESQNARLTPGGVFENVVEAIASIEQYEHSFGFTLQTHVCDCTGYTEVIYVDETVPDPCDGSSWDKAFDKLQDALAVALPCDQIWVADGEYKVTNEPYDTDATFDLPDWVAVLGGFQGGPEGETEHYERSWFANDTVLRGDIDSYDDEPNRVDYVLTSDSDAQIAWLDGFTIRGGGIAGVYCDNSSPIIQHNKITNNAVGIYCLESDQPVIKNNWLYKNDYGIYFNEPSDAPIVRNNTIAYNTYYGVSASDIDPNISISNCILWGNGTQLNMDVVPTYSCIQNWTQGGTGNISSDPCFADAPGDDFLLEGVSLCIDAGDPDGNYDGERDIDKHFRVLNGDGENYNKRVDIGADEYCNQPSSNAADFNEDEIVDTNDLIEMATAWLIDNNDPCWAANYEKYDLNTDDVINYGDFAYFAKEWLWMTCEKMQGYEMMEMLMGMGGGMDKVMGTESMLMAETTPLAPAAAQTSVIEIESEPSIAEQIEQIKEILDWLYEVKNEIDEDTWLGFVTSLEEMLKELQDSQ